jgi:hypothetical protein
MVYYLLVIGYINTVGILICRFYKDFSSLSEIHLDFHRGLDYIITFVIYGQVDGARGIIIGHHPQILVSERLNLHLLVSVDFVTD